MYLKPELSQDYFNPEDGRCPRKNCWAASGKPCVDRSGQPKLAWHSARVQKVAAVCAAQALELLRGR